MLFFDQLKKDDRQLRTVALAISSGLAVLLAGLWWVQVVSARDYQESLETQAFRTVRIPAVRGKILDRNGLVLAENRPTYNISLYLEELKKPFDEAYSNGVTAARAEMKRQMELAEKQGGHKPSKPLRLSTERRTALREEARYVVASNVAAQIGQRLWQPLTLNRTNFESHYPASRVLPFAILSDVDSTNVARFEEQMTSPLGVDLEVQSRRVYPFGTTAAHLLGYLRFDDDSKEGEQAFFSYRLPDYKGVLGIESGYDKALRGSAGEKSVLVNTFGYRQTENVWIPAEPGHNVILTVDVAIQRVAEQALQSAPVKYYPPVRGAVVVMDVNTGDVLALASAPTFNPNSFVPRISTEDYRRITVLQAEKNRATYERFMPGSIFKMVVGLAALEAGWNPDEQITVERDPRPPYKGIIYVGPNRRPFHDTVDPGEYNFRRAIVRSSNAYFITAGLRAGPERIVRLARHCHFGEAEGIPTRQDGEGRFPTLRTLSSGWTEQNTANICIGQDPVWVTPLQVAVMTSAIANGGKVLWPRLVQRIEAQDPTSEPATVFPPRPPRDDLGVSARSLRILHEAMLAETEDAEGTGRHAAQANPGLHICGKTGTAQIQDVHGNLAGHTTWFASFAPFDKPRWAVVVMVEDGISGGETCSRVAGPIYKAIVENDQKGQPTTVARTP